MQEWLSAYVDESGTNELDTSKPGVSHLFICVAIVVDEANKLTCEDALRRMSKELCGGAEIASKRIGGDHKRRLKHLEAIKGLPFGYYALIINKERIFKDSGLSHKRSFYKFINRMLYDRLKQSGKNLSIFADQVGGKDFMDSFGPYLEEHGMPTLFQNWTHSFADSSQTPLIQLADLVAGTLAYCFDSSKKCEYSPQFREILRSREAGLQCWPLSLDLNPAHPSQSEDIAETLWHAMSKRVSDFINMNEDSDDLDRRMQVSTINSLLFAARFEEREKRAVVSDKLIAKLKAEGFDEIGKQAFQSRVIGKIRDEGIILAGASDGYRLALSVEDIKDYLDHDRSVIEPMLARMVKARESVLIDTARSHDILDDACYQYMKSIAHAFQDVSIAQATQRSMSTAHMTP